MLEGNGVAQWSTTLVALVSKYSAGNMLIPGNCGKSAYIARVRRVLKARRAQSCAAICVKSLRKVCLEVVENKGAASSG